MASALEAIVKDSGLLARHRTAVAEFARRAWDWEHTADMYSAVLTTLLHEVPDGNRNGSTAGCRV